MDYVKVDKASIAKRESNDCSVKALSIMADIHYGIAHKIMKVGGRKNGCGATLATLMSALAVLGWKNSAVEDYFVRTIRKVGDDPAFSKGRFLIYTSGHIVSVVDGKVEDWSADRALRIKMVWRIEPAKSRRERKAALAQFC